MRIHRDDAVALPQLQDRLTAAAGRVGAERASRRTRRRAPRLLVAAVACLAFGGTAMAATGLWNPEIGTEAHSGPPSLSDTPVPAAVADVLGVLRREPNDADRSAAVEATLRRVSSPADGVRPESVRYLGTGIEGQAAVLYSAETGSKAWTTGEEPVCVARPFDFEGLEAGLDPTTPAAAIEPFPMCFGVDQILAGYAQVGIIGPGGGGALLGVVPDGVDSVIAKFGSGPDRTVPVANNYFELSLPGAEVTNADGSDRVQEIVWLDADGDVVPKDAAPAVAPSLSGAHQERRAP